MKKTRLRDLYTEREKYQKNLKDSKNIMLNNNDLDNLNNFIKDKVMKKQSF